MGGWGPARQAPPPPSESPRKPGSQVGPRGLGALGSSPSRPFPAPSAPPHQGLTPPPREGVSEWDRARQGQKVKLTLAAGISGQEMTLLYPPLPGGGGTGIVENLGDECRVVCVLVLSLQAKFSPAGGVLGGSQSPRSLGEEKLGAGGEEERRHPEPQVRLVYSQPSCPLFTSTHSDVSCHCPQTHSLTSYGQTPENSP